MKTKENLLIVSRSTVYHNKSGGLETQLDNLINYLKKYFDITVLTTALSSEQLVVRSQVKNEVEYVFLSDTIPGEYGYSVYESLLWQIPIKRNFNALGKSFRKQAATYFKNTLKGKFKLILSQSSSAQDFNITNEKLVLINHGTTLNEIKNRFASTSSLKDVIRFVFLDVPVLVYEFLINNPKLFPKAAKIILISERVKEDFAKQHEKFKNKVTVIPNGIDTNKFKPDEKRKEFTVVYFGRIDNEKGVNDFVETAKILPNFKFEIYGDGPAVSNIKYQISNIKNLKYFGAVSNDEIAKILSRSHVFLFLTKRKEGMPMSIIEAMSSGCIVVTMLKDEILNEQYGYFKVESYKEAVRILKSLEKDFSKYLVKSRETAVKLFSQERMGKDYKDLLNNIL